MPKSKTKRKNLYFKNPTIIEAHRTAVRLGIIKAKSTDARVEELIARDLQKIAPKMFKANRDMSEEESATFKDAVATIMQIKFERPRRKHTLK